MGGSTVDSFSVGMAHPAGHSHNIITRMMAKNLRYYRRFTSKK